MARNENGKRKSGGTQVAEPPADEAQPESLDKVRDILFGSQMRAVETRLQGMEERLRGEHEALRSDFFLLVYELRLMVLSAIILDEAPADYGQMTTMGVEDYVCDLLLRDRVANLHGVRKLIRVSIGQFRAAERRAAKRQRPGL